MTKPFKTAIITTVCFFGFIIVVGVVNSTTHLINIPIAGHIWLACIHLATFPFTLAQPVYLPLLGDPPGGTRIVLDTFFLILGPVVWGAVAFAVQKRRQQRVEVEPEDGQVFSDGAPSEKLSS